MWEWSRESNPIRRINRGHQRRRRDARLFFSRFLNNLIKTLVQARQFPSDWFIIFILAMLVSSVFFTSKDLLLSSFYLFRSSTLIYLAVWTQFSKWLHGFNVSLPTRSPNMKHIHLFTSFQTKFWEGKRETHRRTTKMHLIKVCPFREAWRKTTRVTFNLVRK